MDDEPPDRGSGDLESMVYHNDEEGILLRPGIGEIGVLNPSIFQEGRKFPAHFVYRVRRVDSLGEYSTIDYSQLLSPKKLSDEHRILIKPEYDWECRGCEDPRMTRIGDEYYIVYTAFDGLNVRIALATTKDFKTVKKQGIIGPKMPLREAIGLVGNEEQKRLWQEELKAKESASKGKEIFLYDKDAALHFNGKYYLVHRLGKHIHIAITDDIEELKKDAFWRNWVATRFDEDTIFKPTEKWEEVKIGHGGILDDGIGLYHGVSSSPKNNGRLVYSGSFYKFDDHFNIISRLRDPLFVPRGEENRFSSAGEDDKDVIFPTTGARDSDPLNEDVRWIYFGVGDSRIGYRSVSWKWVKAELEKKHNLLMAA